LPCVVFNWIYWTLSTKIRTNIQMLMHCQDLGTNLYNQTQKNVMQLMCLH
jgi:hypothetical protein